uniref:Uncharacterized protein n=1 Tax=Piliocolobus tephrosceles TaxID=591936 RepID=A0A8C9GIC0_9PRIM
MISSTEKLLIQISPGHVRQNIASWDFKVSDNVFPPSTDLPPPLAGHGEAESHLTIQKYMTTSPL